MRSEARRSKSARVASVRLLDTSGETLLIRGSRTRRILSSKGEKKNIPWWKTLLPFGIHPQSSPRSDGDVSDGGKRFDPCRLEPLDPQKHCGEVMIGALIGASHWGLEAHPGRVSSGSRTLRKHCHKYAPQPPPTPETPTHTKAAQSGGGRTRGASLQIQK